MLGPSQSKFLPLVLLLSILYVIFPYPTNAFSLFDPKTELSKYKVDFTSAPRPSYKITKDSSSAFWIVDLSVQEETYEFPFLILPYTTISWIFNSTDTVNNIAGINCNDLSVCLDITIDGSDNSTNFFNYTLGGTPGFMQAYPTDYTTFFSIDLTPQAPPLNPPLTINGGLGLGIDPSQSYTDVVPPPFLQSFYDLENYVAGIYLSEDNFDATSELLVGDYNPAFIEIDGYNTTITGVNSLSWSFSITTITDINGSVYYDSAVSFNVTNGTNTNQVIFDPNYNAIGIPDPVYTTFLATYMNKTGLNCTNVLAFPTCSCTGYDDFPTLQFNYGPSPNQSVAIPADLYVQIVDNNTCTLLISDINDYAVTQTFNTSWIFGSPVMTYYYTVLDWNNGNFQITLFKTPTFIKSTKWYIMLGAISAVVFVVGLIACFLIIKDRKQGLEEPLVSSVEIMEHKPQESELKRHDENQEENEILAS